MKRLLIAVTVLIQACGAGMGTGSMEEGELYNTLGLENMQLFNEQGMAEVAWSAFAFQRAGLMWDAEDGCQLEARIMDQDGNWSDWRPVVPTWSEGIARTGYVEIGARGVAFQLRHVGGPEPSYLLAEAIEKVGEPVEPIEEQLTEGYASLSQALAPSSLVHPRSDWGARPPACSSGSHSPAKITVHHTATPLPDSLSPTARLRQIQAYHIDSNGWCDIGYHFLVDWNGALWQGRNETVIGAHVANNNTNNVGISFMGTYNSKEPTSSQLSHVANLMAWLHGRYGIPLNRTYIKGHREYRGNAAGDCPGDKVYAKLSYMINLAAGGGDGGGGGGGGGSGNGVLQGVVFEDVGAGTADMSRRIYGATVKLNTGASATANSTDAYWSFSVPAGTYTVTASKSGYNTASRSCTVTAGGQSWCSIGLTKVVTAKGVIQGVVFLDKGVGTSDMSTRLPGATVKLSNGQSATARASDAFWSIEAPAGSYTVTASLSGYQSVSRSCSVTANGETWCSIGLKNTTKDSGGGDTGGDSGGDNGDVSQDGSGGSSGGDTTGDGDAGGDPSQPDPEKGRIFGRVVNALTVKGRDVSSADPVGGAQVVVDGRFTVVADGQGYFEAWVEPGEITLLGRAEGFAESGNSCVVQKGGSVECNIYLTPKADTEQNDQQSPEEQIYGCACSSTASPAQGLPLMLALLMLLRRRR